jgi:hypothetical protein
MFSVLHAILVIAIVTPAWSFKCYSCMGKDCQKIKNCTVETKTCDVRYINVTHQIWKGCNSGRLDGPEYVGKCTYVSVNDRVSYICNKELCNKEVPDCLRDAASVVVGVQLAVIISVVFVLIN